MDAQATIMKLFYRVLALALSITSGAIAGAVFKWLWKVAAREEEAPEASDPERSLKEVLLAAALQGALFAIVKATIERGALQGRRKLTGAEAKD
jgi:hypothetical protein